MEVSFILARLRSQMSSSALTSVGGSADLNAAIEGAINTPSLFVVPLAESAERSSMLAVTMQRQTQEFGVITVVANRRDATGQASLDELTPLRAALKAALIGWVPLADTGEAMQFTGGRLLRFEEGRLWWTDQFAYRTYFQTN